MRLAGDQPQSVLRALLAVALAATVALAAAAPAEAAECARKGKFEDKLQYGRSYVVTFSGGSGVNLRSVRVSWGDGAVTARSGAGSYGPHRYAGGPGSTYRGSVSLSGTITDSKGRPVPCRSATTFAVRIVAPPPSPNPSPPCDALMGPQGCVPRAEFPVADLDAGKLAQDIFDSFVKGIQDDLSAIFAPDTPPLERALLIAEYGSYLIPGALVGGLAARLAIKYGLKAATPVLKQVLGKALAKLMPQIQKAMAKAVPKLQTHRVRVSLQPTDHYFGGITSKGKKQFRNHIEVAVHRPGVKGSEKMLLKEPFGRATNVKSKKGNWQVELQAGGGRGASIRITTPKGKTFKATAPPPAPRIAGAVLPVSAG